MYTVNAFLIWGGGYFAAHGALDYSGGYVIHLSAGISGFVFAWVIGPRLQRDREVDAPNNLLMLACGAGLLWLGWNGFNGGDSYYAGADASAAVLNTNLCTAVAMMVWIGWDYIYRDKPSMIGAINGMITGLVGITPAAGFVNGWGAMIIGVVDATIVWMAIRYLSRTRPFRNVDDTLGVIYTHGIAGLFGGLLVGLLADPAVVEYIGVNRRGQPAWKIGVADQRQLDAAAMAGRGRGMGDRLHRSGDVHHPQGSRRRGAVAALRRGTGDRRSRDPRQRGVPLGCTHPRGSASADMAAHPGCGGRSDVDVGKDASGGARHPLGVTPPRRDRHCGPASAGPQLCPGGVLDRSYAKRVSLTQSASRSLRASHNGDPLGRGAGAVYAIGLSRWRSPPDS